MSIPVKKEVLVNLIEDYSAAKATNRASLINASGAALSQALEQIYGSQVTESPEPEKKTTPTKPKK